RTGPLRGDPGERGLPGDFGASDDGEPLHARGRPDEHGADGVGGASIRPEPPGDRVGDHPGGDRPPDQLLEQRAHSGAPGSGRVEPGGDPPGSELRVRLMTEKLVLGAAIGDCVHVAGILNFLAACRRHGYRAVFLGPATPVERLVEEAKRQRPEILAVSYRLTPEAAERLFGELDAALRREGLSGIRTWFGGPSPVAEVARRSGVFDRVFGDRPDEDIDEWLTGEENAAESTTERPRDLLSRRRRSGRRPLIRHHFGLPSLERTAEGIRRIAEAGVVDVISLAPDQNAQEHFFRPERMDPSQDGAGGVPVRTPDDF